MSSPLLALCWRLLTPVLMALAVAACDVDFSERITPLVIEELPEPQVFVTPGDVPFEEPPSLEEADPVLEIEPIEGSPDLQPLCTTSGLYLRSAPTTEADALTMMPAGTDVDWSGGQTDAEGYLWYELSTADGASGWAASDWLREGGCGEAAASAGYPRMVGGVWLSGSEWEDETENCKTCTHYGVDVAPSTGDTSLYAAWEGRVVGYDDCDDCPEGEGNTHDEPDPFLVDYNYGYGAAVVVEYAYEDLSGADLRRLRDDCIDLQPGESLYLMATHLDRQVEEPEAGDAVFAGGILATMDNSGNSSGLHAHVEVAINASGLEQKTDSNLLDFWRTIVAVYNPNADAADERRGNRVDPSPLFNLP